MKKQAAERYAGVGDTAVKARTGKTWNEWFKILDAAKAHHMPHKDIAVYLSEKHQVPDWWCQMVTVGYEQARGLREKHQRPEGYQVSVSRTMEIPAGKMFEAWADDAARARWLARSKVTVRRATPDKSVRMLWPDGTAVEARFTSKSDSRTQVTVQHSKLADAGAGEKMKAFWSKALQKLEKSLNAG